MEAARSVYEATDAKKAWLALHAYEETIQGVRMTAADIFHEGAYHIAADRTAYEIVQCIAEARSVPVDVVDKLWFHLIEHSKKLGLVVSDHRRYYDEEVGMEDDFLHYQLKPLGEQVLAVAGIHLASSSTVDA